MAMSMRSPLGRLSVTIRSFDRSARTSRSPCGSPPRQVRKDIGTSICCTGRALPSVPHSLRPQSARRCLSRRRLSALPPSQSWFDRLTTNGIGTADYRKKGLAICQSGNDPFG